MGNPRPPIKVLPPADELRRLFTYEPETGILRSRLKRGRHGPVSIVGNFSIGNGYMLVCIDHVHYMAHRLVWKMVTGDEPTAQIDHRDGDKVNNRWANLRPVTNGQNIQNSKIRVDNGSGAKGVCWDAWHRKWAAYISVNGQQFKLGRFDQKDHAISARASAERKMHGEFARP